MISIIFTICFASLLVWSIVDIYLYSIVFDPIRLYAEGHQESKTWLGRNFRYMLGCPFCFSHWVSAAVLMLIWLLGQCGILPMAVNFVLAVLLIPIAARIGTLLRENTYPPIVFPTNSGEKAAPPEDKPTEVVTPD